MWFLNLFIVLEPSLNIECVTCFSFASSVEKKKKKEGSAITKELPAIYKKKKKEEESLFD